ncbi:MAG: T9SS type A sorting domain-containing protein [Ignavibacteria bacterium]|nr:T9SS type A sorting domain-containing protein [Ignavibacteria bacterium]
MNLRVEWSADSPAGPWLLIASSVPQSQGNVEWTVPNQLTTTGYVRISDVKDSLSYNVNASPFSIVAKSDDDDDDDDNDSTNSGDDDDSSIVVVHITSPRTGAVMIPGQTHRIEWITNSAKKIRIQWDGCGDGWTEIAHAVDASRKYYVWSIPKHADGLGVVRIVDDADPSRVLEVSGAFYIKNPIISDVMDGSTSSAILVTPLPVAVNSEATVHAPSTEVVRYEIYSLTGAVVRRGGITSGTDRFNVDFAPGMYLVRWITADMPLTNATPFVVVR